MTKQEALEVIKEAPLYNDTTYDFANKLHEAIETLEETPCEDCISRKEAILQLQRYGVGCFDPDDFSVEQCTRFVISKLNDLKSVNPTYNNEKYKEFAEWVAEEIFSDDWEINKDSFEEIACRKLEKIGIVKLIDGYWVLVESEGI